ncbi:unnamed protein product [Leptosia nina]|uniref:Uncharacterized protein n=1 Tax=Leptosia nina TaxID=320188 RepID=A0AAV1J1Q9_9NEOP
MDSDTVNEEVQVNLPEPPDEETEIKLRPLDRIKLHPKVPIEPSAYGKGKNFSRPWILQDGREVPGAGSEMRQSFCVLKKPPKTEGIRKRMLKDFFWEQMLEEVIEEIATSQPVADYCTEYESHFIKDEFEPRNLEVTADKNGEILEKFRRCQYFTKPMEERLDNGWVL